MLRCAFGLLVILACHSARAEDAGVPSLTIEDWSEAPSEQEQAPAPEAPTGGLTIEEFEVVEPFEQTEPVPSVEAASTGVRTFAALRSSLGVDTSFDSARGDPLAENVFDFRTRAHAGADVKLSESLRLFIEGRAWWRVTAERSFDRTKGIIEVDAGEVFADFYSKAVDLRVGNQVVAFGANVAFAPADALNPRDLREGFILGQPEDVKLPNLGVRALGTTGKVTWTAVYFPFFKPSRYSVTGQDEAVVQPALGLDFTREVHESIEDELQPHLLETERPKALPWLGDLGLRATTEIGPAKVGASWVWAWEKMPRVDLDPELAALVRQQTRGNEADPALAASVQDRLLAGEELLVGAYPRAHVLSLEGQVLLRSVQLDVDLAYSPGQTLYGSNLSPIRKQTVTWVVGLSQAEDSPLLYNVTYVGIAVPDLPSEEYLFLLEPATAAGAPRTVSFHALFATVAYTFLDDRLEVSVRGAVEPIQRSWAVAPRIAWKGFPRTQLALGAELYEGRVFSPFGYFGRNDQIVGQISIDLL